MSHNPTCKKVEVGQRHVRLRRKQYKFESGVFSVAHHFGFSVICGEWHGLKGPIGSRVELMANELLKATVVDNWRRKWQPTLVFLPGESHGQRSLVGYSPWGCKESETTEQLTHTW